MRRPTVKELSLKEKIAQLLMISEGKLVTKGDNELRSVEEIREIMRTYQYGSIYAAGGCVMWMDDEDPNRVAWGYQVDSQRYKRWIEMIREQVRLPMLVAIDSEKGLGYRFTDAALAAAPLAVGAANDPALTESLYAGVAREHLAVGSNWRWAPVVDIPGRFSGAGVGRSFSDDPGTVSRHMLAAIRGMEKENVATNVKHFPGASPYEYRDSHFTNTVITLSLEEWEKTQGRVFQEAIDGGVMTIMSGHKAFPAVDDTVINGRYIPTTLSSKILDGLLRKKMGFEGVIISDDISMAGLNTFLPWEEMLVSAINAGNDILLGCGPYDLDTVYRAVCDGRISMKRIDESCERVLVLKEKIGLFDGPQKQVNMADASRDVSCVNRQIARKAVTLLYDRTGLLPIQKETVKRVAIVGIAHTPGIMKWLKPMQAAFEARGAAVSLYEGIGGDAYDRMADSHDLVIYCGHLSMHCPVGMPSFYDEKMRCFWYAFTKDREKAIGVSTGYPYIHYDAMAAANTFVNLYSHDQEILEAFVAAIYGEIPFTGKSPIDLEPKLRYILC